MGLRDENASATSGVTTALIVDDERDIRELIALTLERIGLDAHTAGNLEEARHLLGTYTFGVCLTDMRLPDGNGVDFVAEVAAAYPDMPIAVITAHGQMDAAVEAMKNGAFDFVSKPVDLATIRRLATQAVRSLDASEEGGSGAEPSRPLPRASAAARRTSPGANVERLGDRPDGCLIGGESLVGRSAVMDDLRTMIRKVARTNAPIWITGESGTGKELVAKLIHRNSLRTDGPFIAVNCGAVPDELMESEFFGHRKGAFTGAHTDNPGLFRSAEGGTLFLDEIAELPLHMQVKLLRAIQERSVRSIGDSHERPVDVRILSASHAELHDAVVAGRFRQDLYYRLNVISVRSPSLRERRDDIPDLARFILARLQGKDQGEPETSSLGLSRDAVSLLRSHDYPGNVRELENVLERALAMCTEHEIGTEALAMPARGTLSDEPLPMIRTALADASRDEERQRILSVLHETRWNRRLAAEHLGLTYRQLRYRIEQHGLNDTADDRGTDAA